MPHANAQVFNEFFASEIEKKIRERNEFLSLMRNANAYVSGKTVHIPNYTHNATIKIDSFQNSDSAEYTTETEVTFNLTSYKLTPIKVEDLDELMTNYDKFSTVLESAVQDLADKVGQHIIWKIAKDANTEVVNESTSGMAFVDMINIAKELDSQNISRERRYFLPTIEQYYSLLQDQQVRDAAAFGRATLPSGVVSQVAGINILSPKPTMPTHTDGTINDFEGAGEKVGLVWHPDMVLAAQKTAKVKTIDAHFGMEVSAEQVAGAVNPRSDKKGLLIIR